MFTALSDYLRLVRAGLVMARHDVLMPEAYRARIPLAARAAGACLRLLPGGGGGGRPGQRLARALEKLGPAWIKLGQFLATRPDLIGMSGSQRSVAAEGCARALPQIARHPNAQRGLRRGCGAPLS